ncbi:unnamed protein product [Amoebophrya sp. A120]|nr:unnamed protein product [Amoebophrya sp. A120]|eukprot:GSA120T00007089001.1
MSSAPTSFARQTNTGDANGGKGKGKKKYSWRKVTTQRPSMTTGAGEDTTCYMKNEAKGKKKKKFYWRKVTTQPPSTSTNAEGDDQQRLITKEPAPSANDFCAKNKKSNGNLDIKSANLPNVSDCDKSPSVVARLKDHGGEGDETHTSTSTTSNGSTSCGGTPDILAEVISETDQESCEDGNHDEEEKNPSFNIANRKMSLTDLPLELIFEIASFVGPEVKLQFFGKSRPGVTGKRSTYYRPLSEKQLVPWLDFFGPSYVLQNLEHDIHEFFTGFLGRDANNEAESVEEIQRRSTSDRSRGKIDANEHTRMRKRIVSRHREDEQANEMNAAQRLAHGSSSSSPSPSPAVSPHQSAKDQGDTILTIPDGFGGTLKFEAEDVLTSLPLSSFSSSSHDGTFPEKFFSIRIYSDLFNFAQTCKQLYADLWQDPEHLFASFYFEKRNERNNPIAEKMIRKRNEQQKRQEDKRNQENNTTRTTSGASFPRPLSELKLEQLPSENKCLLFSNSNLFGLPAFLEYKIWHAEVRRQRELVLRSCAEVSTGTGVVASATSSSSRSSSSTSASPEKRAESKVNQPDLLLLSKTKQASDEQITESRKITEFDRIWALAGAATTLPTRYAGTGVAPFHGNFASFWVRFQQGGPLSFAFLTEPELFCGLVSMEEVKRHFFFEQLVYAKRMAAKIKTAAKMKQEDKEILKLEQSNSRTADHHVADTSQDVDSGGLTTLRNYTAAVHLDGERRTTVVTSRFIEPAPNSSGSNNIPPVAALHLRWCSRIEQQLRAALLRKRISRHVRKMAEERQRTGTSGETETAGLENNAKEMQSSMENENKKTNTENTNTTEENQQNSPSTAAACTKTNRTSTTATTLEDEPSRNSRPKGVSRGTSSGSSSASSSSSLPSKNAEEDAVAPQQGPTAKKNPVLSATYDEIFANRESAESYIALLVKHGPVEDVEG